MTRLKPFPCWRRRAGAPGILRDRHAGRHDDVSVRSGFRLRYIYYTPNIPTDPSPHRAGLGGLRFRKIARSPAQVYPDSESPWPSPQTRHEVIAMGVSHCTIR